MQHKNKKTDRRVRSSRESAGVTHIFRRKSTRPAFDPVAYAAALEVLG
jgi:hypothetical protein